MQQCQQHNMKVSRISAAAEQIESILHPNTRIHRITMSSESSQTSLRWNYFNLTIDVYGSTATIINPMVSCSLLTSSSGGGGGGGRVDLSILRSAAFWILAVDLAFFPMVAVYLSSNILQYRLIILQEFKNFWES